MRIPKLMKKLFSDARAVSTLCFLVISFGVFAQDQKFRIYPQQDGPLIKQQNATFVLTCEYLLEKPQNLRWEREGHGEISSDIKASLYSQRSGRNVFLFVKNARKRDSGTFTCKEGDEVSKQIKLIVIEVATWKDTQGTTGELLGSRLHISCEADGDPTPKIRITDQNGNPFEKDNFDVSESTSQVFINSLQDEDQGTVVVCTATQLFQEEDYTYPMIQEKRVVIDVYFPPRFKTPKVDRYGIPGRNASLVCDVSETNPGLTSFEFHFDDMEISSSNDKYRIDINLAKKKAVLNILKVTEADFGNYQCIARNSKAASEPLTMSLSETSPPSQVQGTLSKAEDESIFWQFHDEEKPGSVPVTEYRVEYLREELLKGKNTSEIERTWRDKALGIHLKKSSDPDFAYEIDNLRPKTKYKFRFRAVSEAGWGDFIELGAQTLSQAEASASTSTNSQQKTVYSFSGVFIMSLLSFFFCFFLVKR